MGVFSPLSILGLLIFAILISLILFLKTNVEGYINNYIFHPNQKSNSLCTSTLLNLEIKRYCYNQLFGLVTTLSKNLKQTF